MAYKLEEISMKRIFIIYMVFISMFCGTLSQYVVANNKPLTKELNINIIEFILKYRITLLKMLYGTPMEDGSAKGLYKYGEKQYSIHVLATSEKYARENNISQETLEKTLVAAYKDFIEKTTYFLTFAKNLNPHVFEEIFFRVICMKIFEMQKKTMSFEYLEILVNDVIVALNTLIESSPKATRHCYERAEKWQKIKKLIVELQEEGFIEEEFESINFLRFIKHNYLDVFLLGEFTKDQIEIFLHEYTTHPL